MTGTRVQDAVDAVRAGRPVVVTDHPGREDEGDLVVAAQHATPSIVAFMMSLCRGLICVPVTAERAHLLELPPMVPDNQESLRTAFTVSVDATAAITTGISAADRATTIDVLWRPGSTARDLVRPGHVFPLVAHPGGVVARPGHTEAAIDLAVLAGLEPAGVICEIADRDGVMLRGERLRRFSRRHRLVQVSIDELADHLRARPLP
ncbi:3,4-dihydroxy-2-butanone-4-phosphate synthase [Cellulomonas sp. URHE0023]|uniref:3,4-dihydroxy-2-butanone-4-phosphate synthase n=1 Tax=Cellulomonas sp. URHE0023 TaxID=1380354 RepID=UPI0006909E34|nr:3,4-dihydroxy-2-butanone-4-phosphate synthase [Cellulomonas sp. URHE0023]